MSLFFQVGISIRLKKNYYTYCGGTLINRRTILTAAHCVTNSEFRAKPKDLYVFVGTTKFNMGTRFAVQSVKWHEKFDINERDKGQDTHDIAVLTLVAPVDLGKNVKTACLPKKPIQHYKGRKMIVSGWGQTKDGQHPEDLQVLDNVKLLQTCEK